MRYVSAMVVLAAAVVANGAGAPSTRPVEYSRPAAEGNYKVTVTVGGGDGEADVTVKAEQRRLMVEHLHAAAGERAGRTFTVNVRTPEIAGGGHVKLKPREKQSETAEWDDQISLEFIGAGADHVDVKVEPAPAGTKTIYVMGDSTVCDQPLEPWASWGQMLPRFFKAGVAVANYAESGESLRSSLGAHRLDKVMSVIKPGDYFLVQFGHNDMKEKGEGVGAFTTYKADLKRFADAAKAKGATVVLITSMERKAGVEHDTLKDYPDAVRALAKEEGYAVVDLNAMSKRLYKALGAELGAAFQDGTHHNNYGAYELAKCVVQGLEDAHVGLEKDVVEDFKGFDPDRPDAVAAVRIPASAKWDTRKPEGN